MSGLARIDRGLWLRIILSVVLLVAGSILIDGFATTATLASITENVGLIGLVAGGLAAKAGFFKLLLPALLAAKKFVIIGIAAIAAFFKKIFGKKRGFAKLGGRKGMGWKA